MDKQVFLDKYTKHLNKKQLEAVQTVEGPVLLLAVPGSGKTTVLVNRLGYMIYCAGIQPEEILTLTYTVAATQDMSKRFESIFGEEMHERLEFRTINGICAKVITRCARKAGLPEHELITDERTILQILAGILKNKLAEYPTESELKGFRTMIAYCKNMMLSEEEIKELGEKENIPLLDTFKEYNAYLRANKQIDYDDQMVYGYRLLLRDSEMLAFYQDKYRYICVDEAQDTSKIQHVIIKLLAGDKDNLFMVGDEDQSIYGFRAAYPQALLDFEKDHPGARVLVMDQNYRSNAKIVAAADAFIQHNKERHDKHMVSVRGAESDIRYIDVKKRSGQYNYLLKVAADCSLQTAVLYRDNDSALPLIDQLDRKNIPFRIRNVEMAFFTNRIVTDVTNMLKFAYDPYDTDLFMKIYFKCGTYLNKKQAEEMCRISREKNIPITDAAEVMGCVLGSINRKVLGNCRGLATNLEAMQHETASKAIFRIENPMGYREYLERGSIDSSRLYILKQLAKQETNVRSFLNRLEYLQKMLRTRIGNQDTLFILSTIHSSKGLEYDRVYLMDAFDGQFPVKLPTERSASPSDWSAFEEERRLFYVGMTRAKNELFIFRIEGESSHFIGEIGTKPEKKKEENGEDTAQVTIKRIPYRNISNERLSSDFELIIGERIIHDGFGPGVINDVEYDEKGVQKRFRVQFDGGEEKLFAFPAAFASGVMKLENGQEVEVDIEETATFVKKTSRTPEIKKKAVDQDTYAYWAMRYPDRVVIKKEGYFWTCRGESAKTINELLGYQLIGNPANPKAGCPSLQAIVHGLSSSGIGYIAVEDGKIVEQG